MRSRKLATFFSLAICAVLTGCQTARVAAPLPEKMMANSPESPLDFWPPLPARPVASNDEAFHALLLYIDASDESKNYDDRVDALKSRKLISQSFNRPADEAIQRGTLAVAIV